MSQGLTLDPNRQRRAREYARLRRRLTVLQLALASLYLFLWLLAGWHRAVPAWLGRQMGGSPAWWLLLLLTAAALSIPWSLLTWPLRYYRGFVLPHRYELSTQTLTDWIVDGLKSMALSTALGVPLLIGLYALIQAAAGSWWLLAAALYTLVTAVLAALAPVLILPIFFQQQPLEEKHESLRQRLLALARQAGSQVEGVYQIDMSRRTELANAALAGLGKTRRILLGDTMLSKFDEAEIETVLAHELAHQKHGDIPRSLAVQGALNFGAFYLVFRALEALTEPLALASQADPAGLPLIGLLLGAFGLITAPLTNAYSRWREGLADEYALNLTRKPAAFARAMTRLANQNLAEADPPRWVVWLLYSHPPLCKRIAQAEAKRQLWEMDQSTTFEELDA